MKFSFDMLVECMQKYEIEAASGRWINLSDRWHSKNNGMNCWSFVAINGLSHNNIFAANQVLIIWTAQCECRNQKTKQHLKFGIF